MFRIHTKNPPFSSEQRSRSENTRTVIILLISIVYEETSAEQGNLQLIFSADISERNDYQLIAIFGDPPSEEGAEA